MFLSLRLWSGRAVLLRAENQSDGVRGLVARAGLPAHQQERYDSPNLPSEFATSFGGIACCLGRASSDVDRVKGKRSLLLNKSQY